MGAEYSPRLRWRDVMTFISKIVISSFHRRQWGLIWLQLVRTGITNAPHYYFMAHIFYISDKCCNKIIQDWAITSSFESHTSPARQHCVCLALIVRLC